MSVSISVTAHQINTIDTTVAERTIGEWLTTVRDYEQALTFDLEFPREPGDPRELSEIPEIRLWFIRLDAQYPWLPFLLDWKAGELARYTAMLVPHQFHPKDGIQFNPEALEIFVMQRCFILLNWLKQQGIEGRSRVKAMAQMLGYELDDGFFDVLEV